VIASDDENDAASVLPELSDDDDELENSNQRHRALVTRYLLTYLCTYSIKSLALQIIVCCSCLFDNSD